VSQGLRGVREAAKERKQERFTALLHHLTVGLLRDSFFALKRQAAPGVDGVTWQEYETGLEDRLMDLHSRVHRGAYQAQPSRRVYIPKADGRQRPMACQRGFCPRDQQLGMEDTSLSPAVTRMVGTVGALVSFQEGGELLRELAGVEVSAKQVERTAEALGAQVAEDERQQVEAAKEEPLSPTLYFGLDGTGIPMRQEELRGRSGKQPDGSAQTREVKRPSQNLLLKGANSAFPCQSTSGSRSAGVEF
jgi:hypothetical protein